MGIALSGFIPQYDPTTATERARQRQQSEAQRVSSADNSRSQNKREQNNQSHSSDETSPRIINGEVLSSETQVINARKPYLFAQSSQQYTPSGQPDHRRVALKHALQTFQDNENLISAEHLPRQVSGLIDEYV